MLWKLFKKFKHPAPAPSPDELLEEAQKAYKTGAIDHARALTEELVSATHPPRGALILRALLMSHDGHYSSARTEFEHLFPETFPHPHLATIYAEACFKSGVIDKGESTLIKLLHEFPDHAGALALLINHYIGLADFDKAAPYIQRVEALSVDTPPLRQARVNWAIHHRDYVEAERLLTAILKDNPNDIRAYDTLAMIARSQRHHDQALSYLEQAILKNPSTELQLYKALSYLHAGHYEEGWALYALSAEASNIRFDAVLPNIPLWNGEDDVRGTLYIICEQGLGDQLQFIRYAALCRPKAKRIVAVCHPTLVHLFKNCPYLDDAVLRPEEKPDCYQIPSMNLPGVFKTTLQTVPNTLPYLFVPHDTHEKWKGCIPETRRKKIGLVWTGSRKETHNGGLRFEGERRHLVLPMLSPLLHSDLAVFYSLQMPRDGVQAEIDTLGLTGKLVDIMADVTDMADTAAIIEQLDLVITVDTSIAHLVGGMGKPLWVMTCYASCWRWLDNKPTDNPWYPHARVFGQPHHGDWDSVVQDVVRALKEA